MRARTIIMCFVAAAAVAAATAGRPVADPRGAARPLEDPQGAAPARAVATTTAAAPALAVAAPTAAAATEAATASPMTAEPGDEHCCWAWCCGKCCWREPPPAAAA